MIEVKGTDGENHEVPTWETFRSWVKRAMIAYVILAIGFTVGVYSMTQLSKQQLTDNINSFAKVSCIQSTKPTSTLGKYNDLIDDLIQSRKKTLDTHVSANDQQGIRDDNAAIARYQADKARIPLLEECKIPILGD